VFKDKIIHLVSKGCVKGVCAYIFIKEELVLVHINLACVLVQYRYMPDGWVRQTANIILSGQGVLWC
jgi:hypothetical protein